MGRIYLSPPDVGELERQFLLNAFDSNWIAPVGPHVDGFEQEIADAAGTRYAVALSSGTAALQAALMVAGVGKGDDVLVPTLTFVATANAVTYVGAAPVFVDSDRASWNIDPNLVAEELDRRARSGQQVAAVITVDLYGQCAEHDAIAAACHQHGVPLIEDAAEALGATYKSRKAGSLGDAGVFSFNGNKIITTSGGGMLVTNRADWADRARHLATQAREAYVHYEHQTVGFNWRLSNLLAAVGRAQLQSLAEKVDRRRFINSYYRGVLTPLPGLTFMPDAGTGEPTWWLTALTVDPEVFGCGRDEIIARLEQADVEARPVWKPMHLQPLYAEAAMIGGGVSDQLFDQGVCLPSGSALSKRDLDRVIALVSEGHASQK